MTKTRIFNLGLIFGFLIIVIPRIEAAAVERYKVINEEVKIHLNPNEESQVVEIVAKGSYLTLSSPGKFRKIWNYVYFLTEKKGVFKSGYIMDKDIQKISKSTRSKTLYIK